MKTNQKTKILASGKFLPTQIVKSDDLFTEIKSETNYNIPTTWMSEQMGIIERRMAPEEAKPSDLAIPAAIDAMKNSKLLPQDIDMVVFCGIERDQPEPATAHTIADALNLNAPYVFDIANACFGFIDGMNIASKFIQAGTVNNALIVTGEITTRVLLGALGNLKKGVDVKTARKLIGLLSVGDAGGAVILSRSEDNNSGFELFNSFSQSQHTQKCYYKFKKDGKFDGQMEMAHLAALMINNHSKLMENTLDQLGWSNFDWMLSHQIGKKPFDRIANMNCIKPSKMIKTYDKLGNITTATFPVNFHKLAVNGKVKQGDRIGGCFAGSGIVIGQFGYSF